MSNLSQEARLLISDTLTWGDLRAFVKVAASHHDDEAVYYESADPEWPSGNMELIALIRSK